MTLRKDPRHLAIVDAQRDLWSSLDNMEDTGSDREAARTCWACGKPSNAPRFRAHIVAACFGGSSDPTNYFLLCGPCHEEQPDAQPVNVQIMWLRKHQHWITALWSEIDAWVSDLKRKYNFDNSLLERLGQETDFASVQSIIRSANTAGTMNARSNVYSRLEQLFATAKVRMDLGCENLVLANFIDPSLGID